MAGSFNRGDFGVYFLAPWQRSNFGWAPKNCLLSCNKPNLAGHIHCLYFVGQSLTSNLYCEDSVPHLLLALLRGQNFRHNHIQTLGIYLLGKVWDYSAHNTLQFLLTLWILSSGQEFRPGTTHLSESSSRGISYEHNWACAKQCGSLVKISIKVSESKQVHFDRHTCTTSVLNAGLVGLDACPRSSTSAPALGPGTLLQGYKYSFLFVDNCGNI